VTESAFTRYLITPVPKPRQTRADKYLRRPRVLRYRAFADELRLKVKGLPAQPLHVVFVLPMPKSWGLAKRLAHNLKPHRQAPDFDNLAKAFFDALFPDGDSDWHDVRVSKIWSTRGEIWCARSRTGGRVSASWG